MIKIGFIDYFLDEWHAQYYPDRIKEISGGEMEVVYAYGLIDSPRGGMTNKDWCEKNNIILCSTIEEVIEKSDVLAVLSPDNCEMHEELCRLPLRSGKFCYVDKTFAPDYATGRRIFDIAEKYNTPCYSTSALRFAPEYKELDAENITAINCWGPNGFEIYSIHQLEPLVMLMKTGASRVMYVPGEGWYSAVIEFDDGRKGTISGYNEGSPFMMNVACKGGNKIVNVESNFFYDFLVELVDFFRTGKIKVPHEETLSIMALRGAISKAQKTPCQWVQVEG